MINEENINEKDEKYDKSDGCDKDSEK